MKVEVDDVEEEEDEVSLLIVEEETLLVTLAEEVEEVKEVVEERLEGLAAPATEGVDELIFEEDETSVDEGGGEEVVSLTLELVLELEELELGTPIITVP